MTRKKTQDAAVSRRSILKGAAVGAVGVAALGLTGCGSDGGSATVNTNNNNNGTTDNNNNTSTTTSTRLTGYSGEGDWLGTKPSVSDSDVTETVSVDVLVLGAGHAGVMCALAAAEAGAKVAVVEKNDEAGFDTDYWHRVGEDIGHVNSQWLIGRGYGPYDTGEVVDEFLKRSGGRVNPELIRTYVENSGAMFDHMIEVYNSYTKEQRYARFGKVTWGSDAGDTVVDFSDMLNTDLHYCFNQVSVEGTTYPTNLNGYKTWPCNAMFQGPVRHQGCPPFISALRFFELWMDQKTKDLGAQWFYEHTAVVLTQDSSGAVTGAIAQDKDGKYKKFVAAKGVLVATGDFGGNAEMCWSLLNDEMELAERAGSTSLQSMYGKGIGHKMVCWAGGMIEPLPRGTMSLSAGATGPWGTSPMLQLNAEGKRFCNEAATCWIGQAVVRQPKGLLSVVTDSNYWESVKVAGLDHGGPNLAWGSQWTDDFFADMATVVAGGKDGAAVRGITVAERQPGTVYGANTLEELAGYLGYTGDAATNFVASIKRYNELCAAGKDTDFGKDKKALIPITQAPFYACVTTNSQTMGVGLVTMAGVNADARQRVLDKGGNVIPNLYVAGNTLGGRYGLSYVTPYAGNSVGMALTHGWLAGKYMTGQA